MRPKVRLCIFLALVWQSSVHAQSQFIDPVDGALDFSQYLSENTYGFLPVPIVITDPAVDGGLGMAGLFFHEADEERDARIEAMRSAESGAQNHLLPPSVSVLAGAYTGNDSYFLGGGHLGFFDQGRRRYMGFGGYGDVNLDFFGFGNIEFRRPISLKTRAAAVVQHLKWKLLDYPVFIGVTQRYTSAEISPNSFGGLGNLLPPAWEEELQSLLTTDVTVSALGIAMDIDTRDNFFSPREGVFYQLEHRRFAEVFGSDIDYSVNRIDAKHYWPLSKAFRFDFRLLSEYVDAQGFLPPFATPAIVLRGIPAMRYQGKLVGSTEGQLTWQIDPRWSALVFAGAGRASNSSSEFSEAPTESAAGLGFRYQIARRYGFDMGLDVARGPEDTVFYITAGSAW